MRNFDAKMELRNAKNWKSDILVQQNDTLTILVSKITHVTLKFKNLTFSPFGTKNQESDTWTFQGQKSMEQKTDTNNLVPKTTCGILVQQTSTLTFWWQKSTIRIASAKNKPHVWYFGAKNWLFDNSTPRSGHVIF